MKSRRAASDRSSAAPAAQGPATGEAGASNQLRLDELQARLGDENDSFLHNVGEAFGMGAGFLVTELLALVPGWNDDLLDEDGQELSAVVGAQREGEHALEKRHQQVVGPQILDHAAGLDEGIWKDLLTGVGEGATAAPGASYRAEAGVLSHLSDWWGGD